MALEEKWRISLDDNVSRAAKGINRSLGKVDKTLGALKSGFFAFAGAAGIGAAVAGFQRFMNTQAGAADEIAKMSDRIGASVEALSEYQYVAERTGVEFRTLTMAWQRMTRRVAEAAKGTGEARGALRELGLEAAELNRLKPEDQFEVLADALAKVPNQADKVRLAMRLFDSEGVKVLQTMKGGADEIERLRKNVRNMGGTLTHDGIDKLVEYNDAMTDFRTGLKGIGNIIAVELAEPLSRAGEMMSKAFEAYHRYQNQKDAAQAAKFPKVFETDDLDTLDAYGDELADKIAEVEDYLKSYAITIDRFGDISIPKKLIVFPELQSEIDNYKLLNDEFDVLSTRLATLRTTTGAGGVPEIIDPVGRLLETADNVDTMRDHLEELRKEIERTVESPGEKYLRLLNQANYLYRETALSAENYRRYLDMIWKEWEQSPDFIGPRLDEFEGGFEKTMDRVDSISEEAARGFVDAFSAAILDVEDRFAAMGSFIEGLLERLAADMLKTKLIEPLIAAIPIFGSSSSSEAGTAAVNPSVNVQLTVQAMDARSVSHLLHEPPSRAAITGIIADAFARTGRPQASLQ